jgi:hypothetical protein
MTSEVVAHVEAGFYEFTRKITKKTSFVFVRVNSLIVFGLCGGCQLISSN